MKKKFLKFERLIEKNKEEILKSRSAIEKIEKKLDKKYETLGKSSN